MLEGDTPDLVASGYSFGVIATMQSESKISLDTLGWLDCWGSGLTVLERGVDKFRVSQLPSYHPPQECDTLLIMLFKSPRVLVARLR